MAALYIISGLLGASVGSFLNLCADRIPRHLSLLGPPSHCDSCGRRLTLPDLVPVLSYLWLRGRCRTCGATIPRRVLWLEVVMATTFVLLLWHYGLTTEFALTAFYTSVFVLLLVIDLEHQLLPNAIIYPALAVAVLLNVFVPLPGALAAAPDAFTWLHPYLAGSTTGLAGGAAGLLLLLVPALLFRGGMGFGDVKMAALIGLVVGFPLVLVAVVMAIIGGGIIAALLLALRLRSRKSAIPFGPFLSLAAIATMLAGQPVLQWYLGFFPPV